MDESHISTQRPSFAASNPGFLPLRGKGVEVKALNLRKLNFLGINKNNKCVFLLIGSRNQLSKFQMGEHSLELSGVKVNGHEKTV